MVAGIFCAFESSASLETDFLNCSIVVVLDAVDDGRAVALEVDDDVAAVFDVVAAAAFVVGFVGQGFGELLHREDDEMQKGYSL